MSRLPLRYPTRPPTASSHWIVPRLLASAYPGKADIAEHEAHVATLVEAGVTHWICLQPDDELKRFTPYHPQVLALCASADRPPPVFIRVPIPDCGVTDDAALIALVERISAILHESDRHRILLHCWGGWTRTGTVAALWMAREFGVSARQALGLYTAMAKEQRTDLGNSACRGPTDVQRLQVAAICARGAHLRNTLGSPFHSDRLSTVIEAKASSSSSSSAHPEKRAARKRRVTEKDADDDDDDDDDDGQEGKVESREHERGGEEREVGAEPKRLRPDTAHTLVTASGGGAEGNRGGGGGGGGGGGSVRRVRGAAAVPVTFEMKPGRAASLSVAPAAVHGVREDGGVERRARDTGHERSEATRGAALRGDRHPRRPPSSSAL